MSLLNNNKKALELVSALSREELAEKLGAREHVNGFVTAAIRNSDTERRKEALLKKNPAGIIAGLKALAVLTGAKGAIIVTPAEGVEDGLFKAASKVLQSVVIEKKADLVKFDHRSDLLVTLDEAAAIAEKLCGEEPGVLVAVDDGELQELPADTKVTELLPASFKAVLTDHRFYAPEELSGLTLGALGSKSGVLRVLSDQDCVVDRAKKELGVLREKCCGRCTFCREGLFQLSAIAEDVTVGRVKPQALELAKELCDAMPVSTNCSLGEDASAPMASLLGAFQGELEAHVRRKECPAGVCAAFVTYYIDPNKCVGSRDCVKVCPAGAIGFRPGYTSMIESFDCTKCGECLKACAQNAIVRVSGRARIPDKAARLKNAAEEAPTAETAPERERGGKRRRSFSRSAGSAAARSAAPAPTPAAAKPAAPAAALVKPAFACIVRIGKDGKRKRIYAKAIAPKD